MICNAIFSNEVMASTDYTYYKGCLIYKKAAHLESWLAKSACKALLSDSNALLLRNTFHFDCTNSTSFWYIVKDNFQGMSELSRRTRNKVRHALKYFDIRPITTEVMIEQGYYVYMESFARYEHITDEIMTYATFITLLSEKVEGREFWGVVDKRDGTLVAYSENYCRDNMCEYFMIKSRSSYLSKGYYPFYGLFYKMNEHYLLHRKFSYVSDGSRSVTEHSNIQPFLISKFKFRKAYADIQVVYVAWLKPIIVFLYPLRNLIPIRKVRDVLRLEAIVRGAV